MIMEGDFKGPPPPDFSLTSACRMNRISVMMTKRILVESEIPIRIPMKISFEFF